VHHPVKCGLEGGCGRLPAPQNPRHLGDDKGWLDDHEASSAHGRDHVLALVPAGFREVGRSHQHTCIDGQRPQHASTASTIS
jgi:hypothetical protein